MHIHILGICGTFMGSLAVLAKELGHRVTGSDASVYPPMSTQLEAQGIELMQGYLPEHLQPAPDLVVIGNALSRGNPAVEYVLNQGLPYVSGPQWLADHVLQGRWVLGVAGTHGKTTTTSMLAWVLEHAGMSPGFLIGGVPQNFGVSARLGGTPFFVVEADEYDSAFFDKRSKFIHYAPNIAVLNNLEFDHADIFRDLADVQRSFAHLTRIVPRSGWVVLNGDDDNLRALGPLGWTRVLRVGVGEQNDVRLVDFSEDATGVSFSLLWRGSKWDTVRWNTPGLYNARNAAMAATAAALSLNARSYEAGVTAAELNLPASISLAHLSRFRGVKRRQETLLSQTRLTVIEDFGHHPTALAETLTSFRARFPNTSITAVFEPRSNTARTKTLQTGFSRALAQADEVFLGAVNRAEKLSAQERFDAEAVAQHLEAQGVHAHSFGTNAELLASLITSASQASTKPRLVVFFTNGSFDGIIGKFVQEMKGRT